MKTGRIFDIQSFSVHDGPGCRTNIFFSGCPLRCEWCANPESWHLGEQLLFSERMCKFENGCTSCRDACPNNAIALEENGTPHIDSGICQDCSTFDCVGMCIHKALRRCSREYSIDEILRIIERDADNWGTGGGVTFSGGEPLYQHEFLSNLIDACRNKYIHTAIETCGYAQEDVFLRVISKVDFVFIDIKHVNNGDHIAGTGVSNELILSNIRKIKENGQHGRIIIRQPVIPGFNDDMENAKRMVAFLNETKLYELNLLRFHRMGQSKWEQLGMMYPYSDCESVSDEKMIELQNFYLDNGIACYVGNEILY